MALDGISALIAVTQMKVDNANNNAMDGASKRQAGGAGGPKGPLYPSADQGTVQNAVQGTLAQIKSSLDSKSNDLQAQDELHRNFEIQDFMSQKNEGESKSSVLCLGTSDWAQLIKNLRY
jgi:hypothetical protein